MNQESSTRGRRPRNQNGCHMNDGWREVAGAYDSIAKQYDNWAWQQFWRRNEFPLIERVFKRDGPVKACLDIGIGTGAYWALHQSYCERSIGIDISVGMLDIFLQRHPNAHGICAQANSAPFRSGSFQRILVTRVLSHIQAIDKFFSEARRVLEPGGTVVISDLDPEHEYRLIRFPDSNPDGDGSTLVPYKHSIDEVTGAASMAGFELAFSWRLRFPDLRWKPPPESLPSLDRSRSNHIFYIGVYRDLRCGSRFR